MGVPYFGVLFIRTLLFRVLYYLHTAYKQRTPPGHPSTVLLGGSWLVVSRVISRITIVITHIKGLITPHITTHEPPSTMNMP